MYNLSDTICAISTPPGHGGIACVRLSGSDSFKVVNQIFSTSKKSFIKSDLLVHMQAKHGYIYDNEKIIDEVIILPFKSPNSFTTEDVVEIFSHGGFRIPGLILDLCILRGARLAQNGEFTFRAFINGRIDLTEAEAINEIINTETNLGVLSASENLTGTLKAKVNKFREKLFHLLATIESSIEFPNDVSAISNEDIKNSLKIISEELLELIQSSNDGKILRHGVKISIIGAPNAGKSSLLNQLLETNRAIVTDIPGTTRDLIEEKIIVDGYPLVLIDTAGIRESENLAESIGIEKTKETIEQSDLVLLVSDLSENKKDNFYKLTNIKETITIGNKIDLIQDYDKNKFDIYISAKHGSNIEDLKKLIIKRIKSSEKEYKENKNFYVNERQKKLLEQCFHSINFALDICTSKLPDDLIADELKKAISNLDEISGKKINDEIMKGIFEKFCIGK